MSTHLENEDLSILFPELKTIERPPDMVMLNGIGFGLYGKRDYHIDTKSYVGTYCFCFLFVPLVAIKSYRVKESLGGGWHFLGQQSLSSFAKIMNWLFVASLVAIVAVILYVRHTSSPEYRAKVQMAIADEKLKQNKMLEAVEIYHIQALYRNNAYKELAVQKINTIIDNLGKFPSGKIFEIVKVFDPESLERVLRLKKIGMFDPEPLTVRICLKSLLVITLRKKEIEAVHNDKKILDTYKLLELVRPYAKDNDTNKILELRRFFLEKLLEIYPQNLDYTRDLYFIYRNFDQEEKSWELDLRNEFLEQIRDRGEIYSDIEIRKKFEEFKDPEKVKFLRDLKLQKTKSRVLEKLLNMPESSEDK